MTGPGIRPLRTNEFLRGWTPYPKQAAFFMASHLHRNVLFGGAAGPGKSFALILAALQYVDVPGYSAIIFRRTQPQLRGKGGLVPKSKEILKKSGAYQLGARFNEVHLRWSFPSGAELKFASLQHDWTAEEHDGLEYHFVGFDELTHFSEYQYTFLGGRMRRMKGYPVPIRQVATSNPGGPGHVWVKSRFGCGTGDVPLKDHIYLPATLDDNLGIDRDAYRLQLQQLDPITRARKLHGDWDIVAGGDLWGETDFPRYNTDPRALLVEHLRQGGRVFTTWDLKNKISTSTKVRKGESFVSGCVWLGTPGRLYLLDEVHGAYGLDDTLKAFWRLKKAWPEATAHYIEDKALGPETIRRLKSGVRLVYGSKEVRHPPVPGVVPHPVSGSKEDRAAGIQPNVLAGDVLIPNEYTHPWVKEWVSELAHAPHAPNDRLDTLVMAVEQHLFGRSTVARGMSAL